MKQKQTPIRCQIHEGSFGTPFKPEVHTLSEVVQHSGFRTSCGLIGSGIQTLEDEAVITCPECAKLQGVDLRESGS